MPDYCWKDSNLCLFGSDNERGVKAQSAQTEPAWKSVLSLQPPTLLVWRVKNFKLEPVKAEEMGLFFSGDSYVILRVERLGQECVYDVHFWIGKDSSQDEYGTAAYKVVELDTLLNDRAIQHREVDGFESESFKAYFPKFEKLEGGYTSGFNKVKPEEFRKRLLVYHGIDRHHVELTEVGYTRRSINSDDVFILDLGTKAYQWNGRNASKDERFKASQFLQELEAERNGRCTTVVIDESDKAGTAEFLSHLPDDPLKEKPKQEPGKKAIYRLSDESGKLKTTLVCEEHLPRGALTHDDAFFIDNGDMLFVYIGRNCSRQEKLNALPHAHEYLKSTRHPLIPIVVVSGGRDSKELNKVLE